MPFAFIHFVDGSHRPVDPGFGYPGSPGAPGQLPVFPGEGMPGQLPVFPGHPGHLPAWGGFPPHAGHLPAWPWPGHRPDNSLPISPPATGSGSPSQPIELPPEIWPPPGAVTPPIALPGGLPPVMVVWIPGHGLKVFHVKPPTAGQLPGAPPTAQPKL